MTTDQYDIIIIGSGMGGLICGDVLSREGYKICVLEKNKQIGGCLQTFARDKVIFDSGVHYLGGLCKGQNLYQVFKYLGLMDKLKLQQLDADAFDKIIIDNDDKEYVFAQGYENFTNKLLADFPGEEEALRLYCDTIKDVCSKFPLYNLRSGDYKEKERVLQIDTKTFIESITSNKKLQAVLAGNNSLYAGQPGKTPLYVHALILNHYIESSWKCVDGGSQIGLIMAKNIRQRGGVLHTNSEVKKIVEENGRIAYVELADGQQLHADIFISNMHPVKTLEIMETGVIRNIYRKRLKSLENSISSFTLNIVLKKNCFTYFKHNYYWHREGTVWTGANYTEENWPLGYAVFLSATSKTTEYAEAMSVLTYMRYDEVKEWEHTFNTASAVNNRGEKYDDFKERKAKKLLDIMEEKFPGLRECIYSYYAATPLSFRDYIGNDDGSLYGIVKNYKDPHRTFIAPQTKLPNLYFTGQNLNMHGILGTALTGLATCIAIMGNDRIIEKIRNA
ncbi:MAG: NAD(P)/FAD-dependent oxidoreductase [Bacteroidota bacterium]